MNRWTAAFALCLALILPLTFNACGSFKALDGNNLGSLALNDPSTFESANAYRELKTAFGSGAMCSILSNGSVKCRGDNDQGQLGDGTKLNSTIAVEVQNARANTTFLTGASAGGFFAIVAGKAVSWGDRTTAYPHLGDAVNAVAVSAQGHVLQADGKVLSSISGEVMMTDITQISSSQDTTCAITKLGAVICTGGQSGFNFPTECPAFSGSSATCTFPLKGFESNTVSVDVGTSTACAVFKDGSVKCIGNNGNGQLGDGTTNDSSTPVTVQGLVAKAVDVVMTDYSACAILATSQVQCWGDIVSEISPNSSNSLPALVPNLNGVKKLGFGQYSDVCAKLNDGSLKCFFTTTTSPFGRVSNANPNGLVKDFEAAGDHYCYLNDAGTLSCLGFYGLDVNFGLPALDVASFSDSDRGGCYVTKTGASDCWSWAYNNNTSEYSVQLNPKRSYGSGVVAVTGGSATGCTALATGDWKCVFYSTLEPVLTGTTSQLLPTRNPSCYVNMTAQTIDCLSQPSNTHTPYPASLAITSSDHVELWADGNGGCVLKAEGTLKCWGTNTNGQLGNGSFTTSAAAAVTVPGLTAGVANFSVGENANTNDVHVCAVLKDQTMKCWGSNLYGELGEGPRMSANFPTPIVFADSLGITKVSLSDSGGCRLNTDRNLRCWGTDMKASATIPTAGLVTPEPFE